MAATNPPAPASTVQADRPGRLTTPLRIALWLTAVWTASGLMAWLAFPLLGPVFMLLSAVAPLAWCWATERRLPWFLPTPAVALLMVATGYFLLNSALWSPSPTTAFNAVIYLALMLGPVHVVPHVLPRLDRRVLVALAAGVVGGLVAGTIFVAIELHSDQALQRKLLEALPGLWPGALADLSPPGAEGIGAMLVREILDPRSINKNIVVLALFLIPAACLVTWLQLRHRHRVALIAVLALGLLAILASPNDASKVALAGGIAVLWLWRLRPALARRLVLTGWVALNLCVVPAALLLYGADLHRATWLPESWRHRVVIWGVTAKQVAAAPLRGSGMDAARPAEEQSRLQPTLAPGTPFIMTTSLHGHNAYLQIWFDTGAVGAVLSLAIGVLALRQIGKAPPVAQPVLLAQFTVAAGIAAFSYSIWAFWFMASLAMSGLLAVLAATVAAGAPRAAPVPWRQSIAAALAPVGRTAAAALARFRPTVASLSAAAVLGVGVAVGLTNVGMLRHIAIDPDAINPEQGFAYTAEVAPRTALLRLMPRPAGARAPAARLTENGTSLGPAGVLHRDIREKGGGRYDLHRTTLYFSATDNSDPRSNGRHYVAVVSITLSPVAAGVVGLLAGLALLAAWPAVALRLAAVAAVLARCRPRATSLTISGITAIAVAAALQSVTLAPSITLDPDAIRFEQGFAYTVEIAPPSQLLLRLPEPASGSRSLAVELTENGTSLGPAGVLHREIREKGAGRYDLNRTTLYFSATDNSDPRTNGRRYVASVPMALSHVAVCAAGLLAGLALLIGWALVQGRAAAARTQS